MPRLRERIGDELLVANGVWEFDPSLPLSPRQVALIIGLGVGQLKERRCTRPPQPPFPFRRKDAKPRSAAWYPLGEALAYKRERMPRVLPAMTSPTMPAVTFSAFLTQALPHEKWPFPRAAEGSLVDFFASLRLGALSDPNGDADCLWLTFETYLDTMAQWSTRHQSAALKRSLEAKLGRRDQRHDSDSGTQRATRRRLRL